MFSGIWNAFLAWLVWLSADPAAIDAEAPKAAAAVAAARASLAVDAAPPAPPAPPPAPGPKPKPTGCRCGCTNGKIKPDGRIEIPCECSPACTCKAGKCAGGKCRP
jgi:hypothetical protein